MAKTPGEHEPIKSISKEKREVRKAFRQADATTAMNEHDTAQNAFAKSRAAKGRAIGTGGRRAACSNKTKA
jgi:hypothetical protein